MSSRSAFVLLVCSTALACATVKTSRVHPDWKEVDQTRVKRLRVVTSPLPDGQQNVGELWSLVARRYVNQKRNFIVKEHAALAGASDVRALCTEGFEGVLRLTPTVKRNGDGVEARVIGNLIRCSDGVEVWSADAAGSWDSDDEHLKEVTAQYEQELGPEVRPYVAPTFRLLRATLDTLPDPVLNEQDIEEKIELGE